jgi:hypothetical protein
MFVTNTLGNPNDEEGWIPGILAPIANSRKEANRVKRDEPITVVIGNPLYKEKAKGEGGWIESGNKNEKQSAPLLVWIPPAEWGIGAHAKHLRNLYVYFWRWATWKVFDHHPTHGAGVVCFITVSGFLNGPGFQKMRDYLRRSCDNIWVIDCSPEGHQPSINTRIFEGVQQPVCIVMASRSPKSDPNIPAQVHFHALPTGHRKHKFEALKSLHLASAWAKCPSGWRAAFLPASTGAWASYPPIENFFGYNGSGVMPGRTWIIAPDAESLEQRWQKLVTAPAEKKDVLFHPHLNNGQLGDRHANRIVLQALFGYEPRKMPIANDDGPCLSPIRYGFRTFDRQWIIPDSRLINRPNPELWKSSSDRQIYLTVLSRTAPTAGPAITFTGLVPDLDHYNGRGGRVFPLWNDSSATDSNIRPGLLAFLAEKYGTNVNAEDVMAYMAATAAHAAFTTRFHDDLSTPGVRIPLTAAAGIFREAAELGRRIIWLHSFGERMADPLNGRPAHPPRLPSNRMPRIPEAGEIPFVASAMPDSLNYDAEKNRLLVGQGYIENVEPKIWNYEISGKQVLVQWFSYRRANRERPLIGERRPPSPLSELQPDGWLAEYTTELINVLNVLGLLVDLEPAQAKLLDEICSGPTISADDLNAAGAVAITKKPKLTKCKPSGPSLFDGEV